jgi:hypothetical protein
MCRFGEDVKPHMDKALWKRKRIKQDSALEATKPAALTFDFANTVYEATGATGKRSIDIYMDVSDQWNMSHHDFWNALCTLVAKGFIKCQEVHLEDEGITYLYQQVKPLKRSKQCPR